MYWLPTLCFTLIHLSTYAFADTEIRNFAATESPLVEIPCCLNRRVLSHAQPSMYLNVTSAQSISQFEQRDCAEFALLRLAQNEHACPYELWVLLDTEAPKWRGFLKFTLRASWPAYQPTQVLMDILDPVSLLKNNTSGAKSTSSTRNKYARLRFVHTGVLSPAHSALQNDPTRYQVSVHLILEPLLFGVLPQSVVPVIVSILLILLFGYPISRKLGTLLQKVARKADAELRQENQKKL